MVNNLERITRQCRCGGTAVAIDEMEASGVLGMTAREVTATVKCQRCGHTFNARVGRLEEYCANKSDEIEFFQRRKQWARDLLEEKGLYAPGDSIDQAEFEGRKFAIRIGPRGGVRIRELRPTIVAGSTETVYL